MLLKDWNIRRRLLTWGGINRITAADFNKWLCSSSPAATSAPASHRFKVRCGVTHILSRHLLHYLRHGGRYNGKYKCQIRLQESDIDEQGWWSTLQSWGKSTHAKINTSYYSLPFHTFSMWTYRNPHEHVEQATARVRNLEFSDSQSYVCYHAWRRLFGGRTHEHMITNL